MASPPATPDVADPGAGRSSVEMHGTYLSKGPPLAALRADTRCIIIIYLFTLRNVIKHEMKQSIQQVRRY